SINLFRVLQESLTNIIRHSGATQVNCSLSINGINLVMTVSDNGKGFNKDDKKNTFGLLGMRERIKSIDGKFILKTG
ncbi:sensor histidine kinase, partial [Salmonella enterica]|uniref:sensor histidine kinase n=1 Tax=Salmonella enterica TaxID=28901 RepID=UPI003D2D5F11